ncbi:MAG: hypothetical protein ACKOOG_08785 [Actinomycetota bacterium]
MEWRPDPYGRFDERLFVRGLATDRVRRHIGRRVRVFEEAQAGTVDRARVRAGGEQTASGRARFAVGLIAMGAGGFAAGVLAGIWLLSLTAVVVVVVGAYRLRSAGVAPFPVTEAPPVVRDVGAPPPARSSGPAFFFDPSQSSWSRRAEAWRHGAEPGRARGPRSVRPAGLPSSEPPTRGRPDVPPDDIIDVEPED